MSKSRTPNRKCVSYIDKSRDFYAAQGYKQPYQWATFDDVPFAQLTKPLHECRIAVVTTASLPVEATSPGQSDSVRCVYHSAVDGRPDRLVTDDLSWDKDATHTNDSETYLPLDRLGELVDDGKIGSVGPRFYGVPTEYSQRATTANADSVERWCREDRVDAVLLVPL